MSVDGDRATEAAHAERHGEPRISTRGDLVSGRHTSPWPQRRCRYRWSARDRTPSRSIPTTSEASSRAARDPRPASGSSPRPRTCQRGSAAASSRTIAGATSIPDLPKANYQVFVRGYGLADSDRVQAAPGKILNLTAKIAPSPKDAAQYYPANYWFAMLNIPAKSEFPIQEQGATAGSQSGGVSQTAQDRRLRVVPSARQQANPRNQPGESGSSSHPKPRGPSA